METIDLDKQNKNDFKWEGPGRTGKILGGTVLISIGLIWLFKQLGYFILPEWVFTWEMFLIVLGIYIGARHGFKTPKWIIPVVIGSVFLIDDIVPGVSFQTYFWPILIIGAGAWMMFSPKRKKNQWDKWKRWEEYESSFAHEVKGDDLLDSVSVFSGIKKNIISKNFKGGEVVNVFGGTEINLTQSDINGKVVLEITQFFGGTKLIIPSNWELQQSDIVTVMGGIEDKRAVHKDMVTDDSKILVLRGTSVFGGIDIKSY